MKDSDINMILPQTYILQSQLNSSILTFDWPEKATKKALGLMTSGFQKSWAWPCSSGSSLLYS